MGGIFLYNTFEVINMITGPKKIVSVLMPMELYDQIAQLAQETRRSTPGYIRQVLKKYLRHIQKCDSQEDEWRVI